MMATTISTADNPVSNMSATVPQAPSRVEGLRPRIDKVLQSDSAVCGDQRRHYGAAACPHCFAHIVTIPNAGRSQTGQNVA